MSIQNELTLEKLVERGAHPREKVLHVLEVLHLTRFMDDKMQKLVRQK